MTEPNTEIEAIRVALREVGEDAVPPGVTTLAAVQWLIGEHKALAAHVEEVGAENSVLANDRTVLAWLHAEAVWQRNENAKQWAAAQVEVDAQREIIAGWIRYRDRTNAQKREWRVRVSEALSQRDKALAALEKQQTLLADTATPQDTSLPRVWTAASASDEPADCTRVADVSDRRWNLGSNGHWQSGLRSVSWRVLVCDHGPVVEVPLPESNAGVQR